MSENKNLFYDLYSKNNNIVSAGYTCSSAIDEELTSFDITSSTKGSLGAITDSNGTVLSSIDLTAIHAEGITQYNTETRILLPYSGCLLQGQEYGLAKASYYYVIPYLITELFNYEKYVSCSFDILYNNFAPYKFHIETKVDGDNTFVDLINAELVENNVEIAVSIQTINDPIDSVDRTYLVFASLKDGYFFYINNLRLVPAFQDDNYPDSPFSKEISGVKSILYTLIEQYEPKRIGVEYGEEYEVDCELYKWLLANYQDMCGQIESFKNSLKYLNLITDDMTLYQIQELLYKANQCIKGTIYDEFFDLYMYDVENMNKLYNIIESLKATIDEMAEYFQDIYWLREDRHMRIPIMKYPNGAFRGIVVVPEWPTNNSEEYEYQSLWVNHILSHIKLWMPTMQRLFIPKIFGVLSNAMLLQERNDFVFNNGIFNGMQTNGVFLSSIPNGWNDTLDTDYVDPYRPEYSVYEDTVYMGLNCFARKNDIVGLFRYMQYVNDEHLWNKIGEAYMIIGKDDDPQSHDLNLPTSLVIYNPNSVPVRIKYMIFS